MPEAPDGVRSALLFRADFESDDEERGCAGDSDGCSEEGSIGTRRKHMLLLGWWVHDPIYRCSSEDS
eukprot:15432486-Alexandrium_andersonii.AAC.1